VTVGRSYKKLLMCLVLLKANGVSSSSPHETPLQSIILFLVYVFLTLDFGFGDLLDDLKGHLFFYSLSFNSKALF